MTHRRTRAEIKALDKAAEAIAITRAATEAESKQPRFGVEPANMQALIYQIYGWGKELIYNEPKYSADSRRRDTWMREAVTKEPFLLGIQNSIITIDKNRGFTLTGGKIQVKRFLGIAHDFQVSPDLSGWRPGISVTAKSYYQSDLGGLVELGRLDIGEGAKGPLAALYAVDPTKCRLTGNATTPLQYAPGAQRGGTDYWTSDDYFRVVSFPDNNETVNGLGYCAASRCIELAKLVVSIFEHYREKLGSRAPKGIMTINGGGITQKQWLESLEESKSELAQLQREYYSGVQVLVAGSGKSIDVNLVPLSNLPDEFDLKTTIDMMIYGYALAHGYDPREFWPVGSGTLGTGRETETQHRKATTKGGMDFALEFQENFQRELPPTVEFEFEQRDVEGDIAEVAFQKAKLDIVDQMYKSVNGSGEVLITHDQAMQLMVEAELIPEDWTLPEEDVTLTDTDDAGELAEKQRVRAAMEKFPDDDIVQYSSSTDKFRVIRKAGEKVPFTMRVAKKKATTTVNNIQEVGRARRDELKKRAGSGDYGALQESYWNTVYLSVSEYLAGDRRSTAYKSAMQQAVVDTFTAAVEAGYVDGGGELPMDEDTNDWLTAKQAEELANVDSLFVTLAMLRKEGDADPETEGNARADGYLSTLDSVYGQAVLYGSGNKMLTWNYGDTDHCKTCEWLNGQRHRASWYIAHDYIPGQPGSETLECGGYRCACGLSDDEGNQVTI